MKFDPKSAVIFVPMLSGYLASYFCGNQRMREGNTSYTPPGWVFGIVWPILYTLIGYSWYRNIDDAKLAALYGALVALLTSWIPITSCFDKQIEGVWIIVLSILLTSYCMLLSSHADRLLLLPLLVWLLFATLLSVGKLDAAAYTCSPVSALYLIQYS